MPDPVTFERCAAGEHLVIQRDQTIGRLLRLWQRGNSAVHAGFAWEVVDLGERLIRVVPNLGEAKRVAAAVLPERAKADPSPIANLLGR